MFFHFFCWVKVGINKLGMLVSQTFGIHSVQRKNNLIQWISVLKQITDLSLDIMLWKKTVYHIYWCYMCIWKPLRFECTCFNSPYNLSAVVRVHSNKSCWNINLIFSSTALGKISFMFIQNYFLFLTAKPQDKNKTLIFVVIQYANHWWSKIAKNCWTKVSV